MTMSGKRTALKSKRASLVALALALSVAHTVRGECVGDCDESGAVEIAELIRSVAIALGTKSVEECSALDANEDGKATISELVLAVKSALGGCIAKATKTPRPSDTPTVTPSQSATPSTSGFIVAGCVPEFPTERCGQIGVRVRLEPLGTTSSVNFPPRPGTYRFENIPPGTYTVSVTSNCNPFGCWEPVTFEVTDENVEVDIPLIGFTPTPTQTSG